MTELQNAQWPGWETVGLIGRGSFGAVYEIQRDVLGETEKAALKVITIPQNASDIDEMYSDGYDDESITSTFQSHLKSIVAEYSLMRKMNGCANIVNCDDIRYVQHEDGIGWDIFIKMELLLPLTKALPADLSEETVIRIAKDMCAALQLCKEHGIVHRDIKPQNIFVSSHGDYKLGDFGIAKTVEKTMGGTKIGTYKYMAPEVYNNQPYGASADIYSLGLVLYWLLNERRMPFLPLPPAKLSAGMDETARSRRLSGEQIPEPAHGSAALKRIVLKACAYSPKDRYESAADMLADLNAMDTQAVIMPTPNIAPADDATEEGTVGPIFGHADPGEEKTIGPDFAKKPAPSAKKSKKKSIWLWIAAGVGVMILIIVLLMLKSCNGDPGANPSTKQDLPTSTPPATSTTQIQNKVESITVKSAPAKTAYFVGDTLDTTGLTLSVVYADGTSTLIADGFTCDKTTLDEAGTYDVVITYAGVTTTFTVEVKEPSVTQIHISTLPAKTVYYIGDAVDTAGLELTVTYDNGKEETITEGFICAPEICAEAGTQTVTISYGGQSTSYDVEVQAVTLTGISIKSEPSKLNYYEGDTLDVAGLTLLAVYSNGETQTITGGFTCDPMELTAVGKQTITVTYGLYIATFEVNVEEVVVTDIAVEALPKTNYYTGDTLDTAGLKLTVRYNNGKTETITSGFQCSPTKLNEAGTKTITVSYHGKTATFTVNVTKVAVSSISIKSKPTKTSYYTGDTLNTSGLALTVNYNNGTSSTVTSGFTCSLSTLSAPGTQTVTVTYNGKQTTFSVDVRLHMPTAPQTIATEHLHSVALKSDGTVVAVGRNDEGQCNVSGWRNIVSVSAGSEHTVGLKADGTVVAVGDNFLGQCNVSSWTNIVAVSAASGITVGLKADGTVVTTSDDCSEWRNIVAVDAGNGVIVGLKADGTVVAVGNNSHGQCNVSDWTNIVSVSAGDYTTVGIKSDGTVVAVGWNANGQCDIGNWTNIVSVSAGPGYTVGLKADGTVISTSSGLSGADDVGHWTDIIAVSTGRYHTIGLKADGTVVSTEYVSEGYHGWGQCNVGTWKNIKLPTNYGWNVAGGKCGDNAYWRLTDYGALTIYGTGAMRDYESYEDTPWQKYSDDIRSIYISDGITTVGVRAFVGCNVESVRMADSVTTIGMMGFLLCEKLTDVQLSNNITSMGYRSFMCCGSLETITLPRSVEYVDGESFMECDSLTSIYIMNPRCELDYYAFHFPEGYRNGLTFYGYKGSTAQSRAESDGFAFVQLVYGAQHGDKILIYAPRANVALSTYKVSGYYNWGCPLTEEEYGKLSGYGDTEVWTVIDNGDHTWSFRYNGQNLGMADNYSDVDLGDPHDKWEIIALGDGTYHIRNVTRGYYLCWNIEYQDWATFDDLSSANHEFAIAFYFVE